MFKCCGGRISLKPQAIGHWPCHRPQAIGHTRIRHRSKSGHWARIQRHRSSPRPVHARSAHGESKAAPEDMPALMSAPGAVGQPSPWQDHCHRPQAIGPQARPALGPLGPRPQAPGQAISNSGDYIRYSIWHIARIGFSSKSEISIGPISDIGYRISDRISDIVKNQKQDLFGTTLATRPNHKTTWAQT